MNNSKIEPEQIFHISRDEIIPPDFDQRFSENLEEDKELQESIGDIGILLPLIVRKKNDKYEIVAGNRRFKAAGKVGLSSVPCLITTKSDEDVEKIKLHENTKRLPLSHIDQALTFLHLIETYKLTETSVSDLVGKSVTYVCNHLCLLKSDEILIDAVKDASLNFSVARELMYCKNKDDLKLFIQYAKDDGATVAVVQNWVAEANKKPPPADDAPADENDTSTEPPSSEPGFVCPACKEFRTYRFLKILKICSHCEYSIFEAIKLAQEEKQPDQS